MSERQGLTEWTRLEARLRDLPQPMVPPELERKLLDAVPETVGGSAPCEAALWKRIVPAIAVAAAAVVTIVVLLREPPVSNRPIPAAEARATSPDYVLAQEPVHDYQETKPCNILPPLPPS